MRLGMSCRWAVTVSPEHSPLRLWSELRRGELEPATPGLEEEDHEQKMKNEKGCSVGKGGLHATLESAVVSWARTIARSDCATSSSAARRRDFLVSSEKFWKASSFSRRRVRMYSRVSSSRSWNGLSGSEVSGEDGSSSLKRSDSQNQIQSRARTIDCTEESALPVTTMDHRRLTGGAFIDALVACHC